MKVKWVIEVDGEVHMVEVEHGDYSGKKVLMMDGNQIHDSGAVLLDRGLTHSFYINAHCIEIKIISNTFTFEYYCTVDGINVDAVADAEINGAEIAWQFDDAEGDSHQVELNHTTRNREVLLDGVSVYKKGGFFSNFFLESDEVEFQVTAPPPPKKKLPFFRCRCLGPPPGNALTATRDRSGSRRARSSCGRRTWGSNISYCFRAGSSNRRSRRASRCAPH